MRIGLIVELNGTPRSGPAWSHIENQVLTAERVGFDLVVFEDAFAYSGGGIWNAMVTAGALAKATSSIGLSHSVVNAPLYHPARIAQAAATIDEISDGRYTLGIGAGNTPDDYAALDIDADPRFSRFVETIEIVHALLRTGTVAFSGDHYRASTELIMRGPRSGHIPIVIAAGGPRMIELCARRADGWNWWGGAKGAPDYLDGPLAALAAACEVVGRDPASIERSVDVYTVDVLGVTDDDRGDHVLVESDPQSLAETLLDFATRGIDETRVHLAGPPSRRAEAAEAMADLVRAVHSA